MLPATDHPLQLANRDIRPARLPNGEEIAENYLAFLHLACAQLIFAKVEVFG